MITPKNKAFISALMCFDQEPNRAKAYFEDKRLTFLEKEILRSLFLFRNNKLSESLELIEQITEGHDLLVHGIKLMIKGVLLISHGKSNEAVLYLKESIEKLGPFDLSYLKFTNFYNLFIAFLNLKNFMAAKEQLELLEAHSFGHKKLEVIVKLSKFYYLVEISEKEKALRAFYELDKMTGELSDTNFVAFYQTAFDYFFSFHDLDSCEECLTELKNFKTYSLSTFYKYYDSLFQYYRYDRPIYNYDYEGQNLLLKLKLKVILALQSREFALANNIWNQLRQMRPQYFFDNYKILDSTSLFAKCLKKTLQHNHETQKINLSFDKISNAEKILKIFDSTDVSYSKDELYEAIFNSSPSSKDDYKKLAVLISKMRRLKKINLKMSRGCYKKVS